MLTDDSNDGAARGKSQKPNKPHPDFPLYAYASGRWAKKVRGRTVFFSAWSDPDGALAKWLAEKDALLAGRRPRQASGGVTVKELANRFLNAKQALVDSGELTRCSWEDYCEACDLVVAKFGRARVVADLDPDDFGELRKAMVAKGVGDDTDQTLAKEFGKLLRALGIRGRKGLGFYTLRHTFRTVADEAKDQPAADYIMGHESPHMSSHYRETISHARLKAVSDYVRAWAFAEEEAKGAA
jgi:hypothetical protein